MAIPISTEHEFYYQTDEPVSAKLLADSLLGLDGVARRGAQVFAKLLPDTTLIEVDVLVRSVELGSYKENFIVRMVLGDGEAAEKKIEELRKTLKLDTMTPRTLLSIAIMGAVLWGVYQHSQGDPKAAIHIENSFNTLGADVNMRKEDLMKVVESALEGKKEELKKSVVKLVHPGGIAHTGRITLDKRPELTIPEELVRTVPVKYEKPETENPTRDFDNVQIVLRAADLDNPRKGWAGIITDFGDSRLPLEVSSEIDPATLALNRYFQGDITVIYSIAKNGERKPMRYFLRAVRAKENSKSILDAIRGEVEGGIAGSLPALPGNGETAR